MMSARQASSRGNAEHDSRLRARHGLTDAIAIAAMAAAVALAMPVAAAAEADDQPGRADTSGVGGSDTPTAGPATDSDGQHRADHGMERRDQASGQSDRFVNRLPERYKLSNWLEKSVVNSRGETLGRVEDLVIDDLGMARYVVLETDLLGEENSDRLIAVPAGHFSYPLVREGSLVLDVSLGRFTRAPRFGTSGWPNMGDKTFSSVVIGYWLPEEAADRYGSTDGGHDSATSARGNGDSTGDAPTEGRQATDFDPNRDMITLSAEKRRLFERLDSNRDGVIDRDEAARNDILSARFEAVDSYADEAITRSELAAFDIPASADDR